MKILSTLIVGALGFMPFQAVVAQQLPSQRPLLLIGASYAEAKTPYINGIAPLGGIAVGFGSYLSLGSALVRNNKLPGYVITEAQAGATSFDRLYCAAGAATCGPARWDGYQTQLERAISRVAIPPTFNALNAKYVVIVKPNDCLHADAFGVPQSESQPCSVADMNGSIDRMIAVGQYAIARGLTPIYDVMPRYESLDLPSFKSRFGLQWVISEDDYKLYRTMHMSRIGSELPGAIVLDFWKDFVHAGDGLHPNDATNRAAASVIAKKLLELDQ
jgi:hypothetical protein